MSAGVVWEAIPNPDLRLLSLGAGVQSSAMLLMGLEGRFGDAPDGAIFADTQWEPEAVYRQLEWLEARVAGRLPIYRVSYGNIREDILNSIGDEGQSARNPPFWVHASCNHCRGGHTFSHSDTCPYDCVGDDGCSGAWEPCVSCEGSGLGDGVAPLRRKCTSAYKIEPIDQKVRELLGVAKGCRVKKGILIEKWIGISTDEASRIKPSGRSYIANRYPLIERGLSRRDCLEWMRARGYPEPPKSACVACPYRSDEAWAEMKVDRPAEFDDACFVDDAIRDGISGTNKPGVYVHRSLQPLRDVEFRVKEALPLFAFIEECSGLCGN